MKNIPITTIITTYRRPLLLKRAIHSVLKQTYPHFQVCVYDNASNDETEEMMQKWVKIDPRIHYHRHPKNIGMMPNYQYAFEQIATPYFSLLSDDDYLLPNFFETALNDLKKFENAAFSACSVVQIDDRGNYIGDPLALWRAEGYYAAADGLIEMIKTRWRFPVPTGVLFRHELVKNIKPDFSPDIELFWDPDYLLRIAAEHPIVISKKRAGVYLAHSQSYANSYYVNLLNNVPSCEKYLVATKKIASNIIKIHSLNKKNKHTAKNLFNNYVKKDVMFFMKSYLIHRKLGGAHFLAQRYYCYFGFSREIVFMHIKAILLKIWTSKMKLLKSLVSVIFNLFIKNKKQSNSINMNEIQNYYQYGKELLDEPL